MFAGGSVKRFHYLFWVLVVSFLPGLHVQAAPVVVSVDHRVMASYSKLQFDAKKNVYTTQVRIVNRSGAALLSPLQLSFDEAGLRIMNARGIGKDGRPYFELKLPKGLLLANASTDLVSVEVAAEDNKLEGRGREKMILAVLQQAQHVSAGVVVAPLAPRAEPYALKADAGKVEVRFNVALAGASKRSSPVFLRRVGDGKGVAMNDQGRAGDLVAGDGIYGISITVDSSAMKSDTCLKYEAYIRNERTETVSPSFELCASEFPLRVAASNTANPVALPEGVKAVADELLVTTRKIDASTVRRLASAINATVVGGIPQQNLYQLRLSSPVDAERLKSLASRLGEDPGVGAVSFNAIGTYAFTPSDTQFASQHGLQRVRAHDSWDLGAAGNGVTVIVLDSGLDRTHPDFGTSPGNCQLAEDDCGAASTDAIGHGTQVAGVAGARTDNALGVAGVAYRGKIHAIQVSADAVITDLEMIQGFNDAAGYVAGHGAASVINASFSVLNGTYNWTAVCTSINSAVLDGVTPRAVVVNAVGNNGLNGNFYPARCNDLNAALTRKDLLLTVANSTSVVDAACGSVALDQRCSTSNYGAWVDIAAPGSVVATTAAGGGYISPSGTSFSSPMVAGAAAILRSCGVAPDQIESTMRTSANVTVPFPDGSSAPRLDIYRAMQQLNHVPSGVGLSNLAVNENTATPLEVGTLVATDADTCDRHTFTIVPGGDGASFNITGDKLNFNAGVSLNREVKASYAVTVHAVDFFGAAPAADTLFTITINDVDEFDVGSVVDMDVAANSVIENSAGVVGLTASASDTDATNNAITYSLTSNPGGRFAIHPSTGVVSAIGAIDRETASSYDITIRATSSDGSFSDQTYTINIVDVDEFDVGAVTDGNASANTVAESAGVGTAVGLTAAASDADATNNSITYSLSVDAGGRFIIDPVSGGVTVAAALDHETGPSHNITVMASGSDGSSNSASFSIAVTNVNEAPVANPDTLAATQDMPANYLANMLLSNDTDVDGTSPTIATVTSGSGGTAVKNGDGSVTFTPTPGFSGTATFTYTVTDGVLTSNTATVTVNVAPVVPHPPVAFNDSLVATEDVSVTFAATALLGNDTDVDAGTTLAVYGVTSGAGATVILNPDGTVTFNPNANFHGAANFTYTATDGGLTSNVATVTVNVAAVNDSATGAPVILGTRTVGQTLTSDISAIADNDGLGTLHYQWLADGSPIGTDSGNHLLTSAEFGKFMQLRVSFTDGDGNPETRDSVLDAVAVGDPHITTVDGLHYDFQSAGEFVALRGKNGMELQLRMMPVSTATPLTDPNSGLSSGVSVNTGLAARVGTHRVTYQAEGGNAPVLRVDGMVMTLAAGGLDLGGGGRLIPQGNGIQIDFPDQTSVVVSSSLWSYYNVWWLHVSVFHTPAFEGVMGARKNGSWLPRLSDGSAFGAMPAAMHDRYVELYVKFADSWRVNNDTSLFDYTEGTSTATYTNKSWPTENGPFVADNKPPVKQLQRKAAQLACRDVFGKVAKADCEFDVMVMGHQDVAKGHLQNQKVRLGATQLLLRAVDAPALRGGRVYLATVTLQAVAAKLERRALIRPAGTVQFMLDGMPLGKPVKLDAKGQAALKMSPLKIGNRVVTARFIPAKGSVFLPSVSTTAARAEKLKPTGTVIRDIR